MFDYHISVCLQVHGEDHICIEAGIQNGQVVWLLGVYGSADQSLAAGEFEVLENVCCCPGIGVLWSRGLFQVDCSTS
jgi:hypothetical protein